MMESSVVALTASEIDWIRSKARKDGKGYGNRILRAIECSPEYKPKVWPSAFDRWGDIN